MNKEEEKRRGISENVKVYTQNDSEFNSFLKVQMQVSFLVMGCTGKLSMAECELQWSLDKE